ncbi:hypothetical protein [Pedobacter endophyticus]|nr:hypothetical protein [Pedobacter endophyticus]
MSVYFQYPTINDYPNFAEPTRVIEAEKIADEVDHLSKKQLQK